MKRSNEIPYYARAEELRSPSYISFQFALAWYGFIPERVYAVTSAFLEDAFEIVALGGHAYTFYGVPESIFAKGVREIEENGFGFKIATPGKCLLDHIYAQTPNFKNLKDLDSWLEEDQRMELEDLSPEDKDFILRLAPEYVNSNVTLFAEWIKREG